MEGFGATNPETTPAVPNDQEEGPHQLELQFYEERPEGEGGGSLMTQLTWQRTKI